VLTGNMIANLRWVAPAATCVNFYGTTETPQAAAFYVISDQEQNTPSFLQRRIPLGRGISGVQLLVLNAAGMPAGIGEVGEIFVRTPYLTSGYLHDPALTAERFIVNQFRVELTEVEAVLSEYPAVQQAVVTAVEAAPGDRRLTAYIIAKDQPVNVDEV